MRRDIFDQRLLFFRSHCRILPLVAAFLCTSAALAQQSTSGDNPPLPIRGTPAGASSAAPQPAIAGQTQLAPINYGKPKKAPRLLPKRNGAQAIRPLPALQPYRTAPGQRRRNPLLAVQAPGPTVAAIPELRQPRRAAVEANPYAPVGFDAGSLRLTPYVESDLGYDGNASRASSQVRGSFFARGEAGVTARSDWSVHEFDATLKGGYSDYFTARDASRPDASVVANARIDATRDTAFDLQGRFTLDSQNSSTPGLLTGTTLRARPLTYAYGASAGVTEKVNRLTLSLRGSIDRYTYEDASLAGGQTIVLSNQDYNAYGLRGRAGYEITPGITPFVDVAVDTRRYDSTLDGSGFARNSNGYALRAGSSFELTRVLTGEVSAGYSRRSYTDRRLADLSGPAFDASLVWSASPLTTVTLRGVTDIAESSIANASGALTRRVSLEVAHSLMRNFTLSGIASYTNTDYQGVNLRENLYSGTLRADYNLTRSIVIRSSFTHERLKSSAPGSDYTANTVLLGLRLQR